MSVDEALSRLREAIDQVDVDLLRLFNKRMELSLEVGRIKAQKEMSLFDPGREELIFQRLTKANPGPLSEESLRSIYREIFAASRLLQHVLRVAFLGPEWSYSHLAGLSLYGQSVRFLPLPTLEDLFDALSKGKAHVAVVPVENSLHGAVGHTMDLLYEREVQIVSECYLEIAHYLCSPSDSIQAVKHLYAPPLAVEQSRKWILENLRHVELHECPSTADAAQMAKKDPEGAAICNLYAAHYYEMKILAERIEDRAGNMTRFLALGDFVNSPTGNDKTSVLFAIPDQPGALHTALEAFAHHKVNLIRIDSRPNRLFPWQYLFHADIEGHTDSEALQKALSDLKNRVTLLKVLGSYPKGDPKHPVRLEKEKVRSVGRPAT